MKKCSHCGETKPLDKFYRRGKNGHQGYCKKCSNQKKRAWMKANPEKDRQYNLKGLYGLTPAAYDDMLAGQGGGCAVCSSTESLVVDHNHETGEVRGILCSRCNSALGLLKDSPVLLNRASSYLIERGYYG